MKSKLQITSDLAQAAALLFEHGLITLDQGQKICAGVFDLAGADPVYDPIFYVALDDKEFWSLSGWHGEALDVGPENGAEVLEFIKGRPKYNSLCRLEKPGGWCMCARRALDEVAMPRQGSKPAKPQSEPAKPETPQETTPASTTRAPAGPMSGKRGPGRPKKAEPVEAPKEESKPATPSPMAKDVAAGAAGNEDIPF